MEQLRRYLLGRRSGPIPETEELVFLLADCWDEFQKSPGSGMDAAKLYGRMEDVVWDREAETLAFIIERHGGMALGSSRGELQYWTVRLADGSATFTDGGFRQINPRQKPWKEGPAAQEIARAILDHDQQHQWLKWKDDGSVRVLVGKVLPESSAAKETLAGRRKRLRRATSALLEQRGWNERSTHVYQPPAEPRSP